MKQGRHAIFLFLIISVLIFSSCSRQIEISSEDSATPSETSTPKSSAPAESDGQNQPENTPEATPESEQASPTPETVMGDSSIQPVPMSETGMNPIPVSDLNGAAVNPRIVSIIESYDWNNDDFTKGIDQFNNVYVIYSRFSDPIAGQIKMESGFSDIESELGSAGYKEENMLVYRTANFYLAFYGADKADFVAFTYTSGKDYDVDFLYKLIEELDSDSFTSLDASIEKLDPDMDFFNEKGSSDGANYYANSLYGINVSDIEEPIINVMNNYEGNLYTDTGDFRYSQVFVDQDSVVLVMRDALVRFDNISKTFKQDGVLSPDGLLKAVYLPDECIIIRTLDNSIQDRNISTFTTGEFYWLGSRYIIYMDDFTMAPSVVDLDDSMLWGVSMLEQAGVTESGNFKITGIKDQVITLEEQDSGTIYNIKYSFDGSGKIGFSIE